MPDSAGLLAGLSAGGHIPAFFWQAQTRVSVLLRRQECTVVEKGSDAEKQEDKGVRGTGRVGDR
jgi:hypothetical protein